MARRKGRAYVLNAFKNSRGNNPARGIFVMRYNSVDAVLFNYYKAAVLLGRGRSIKYHNIALFV